MMSVTMPKYGRIMMYTSGWPNHQNRCWYRTTDPPWVASKKWPPKWRSMNTMDRTAASGGNATRIINDVTIMFQQNKDSRHMVMPGARSRNVVAIRLTAVMIEDTLVRRIPMIHMSGPAPGV